MLHQVSVCPFDAVESAIRLAAEMHGATLLPAGRLGDPQTAHALVFPLDIPGSGALLRADPRFSAFLPCRVAAYPIEGHVHLLALAPRQFCRILDRPDLADLVQKLEDRLSDILQTAAAVPESEPAVKKARAFSGIGATEANISMVGTIPQRIDAKGSKVEDMAGTGSHDSQGG